MSITINKETLDQAQSLLNQGKVHEAWETLGNSGDNYAINAAKITDKNNDSFAKTLVKETWENTVGMAKYNEKFDAVARQHLVNYLNSIKIINGNIEGLELFVLPKTEHIEASYGNALETNGISTKAAIDGIINTVISGGEGIIPGWDDWIDLFDGKLGNNYDIEKERVSNDTYLKSDYTRFEAVTKILTIGTESIYDETGFQTDLDIVINKLNDLYGDSKSFLKNLFSKQIEDQQAGLSGDQIDNSQFNLTINTDLKANFASSPTQTGTVIGEADWSANMPKINDDGFFTLKKHAKRMFLVKNGVRSEATQPLARVAIERSEIGDEVEIKKILVSNNSVKTIKVLLASFLFLLFSARVTYAEGCKSDFSLYTGCKGEEGYIHIPRDYKQKSNNPLCQGKYQIFKGNKLPKVGSKASTTIGGLMFYKDLNKIYDRYKICDLEAKSFKRKDLFGRNEQEAHECLTDVCMTFFDKHMDNVTGDEDILHRGSEIKILSYEQFNNDLFTKIKVTK